MSDENVLWITHALLWPATASAAIRALRGRSERAAVEGLVELLHRPHGSRDAVAAVHALEASDAPIILDALDAALDSPHASVRLAAVQDLHRRRAAGAGGVLGRVLGTDESWPVRRSAVYALAAAPGPGCWRVLAAATDPHWRVRHALIQVLLDWGADEARQDEIHRRLTRAGPDPRAEGVRAYLRYRCTGQPPPGREPPASADPAGSCPCWDWDTAVLLRNLGEMGEKGRRQALDTMPVLLTHTDERVRAVAAKTLRDWGDVRHLAPVVALLGEPRQDGAGLAAKLLSELDEDRREGLARSLLHGDANAPAQLAWALDQVGSAVPVAEEQGLLTRLVQHAAGQPPIVRRALARLAGRWEHPDAGTWLRHWLADTDPVVQAEALRGLNRRPDSGLDRGTLLRLLASEAADVRAEAVTAGVRLGGDGGLLRPLTADPDFRVRVRLAEVLAAREEPWACEIVARLRTDAHPHVRAATLTATRAAELLREPGRETSWHVLGTAARLARVPLWKLEPAPPWQPTPVSRAAGQRIHPSVAAPPVTRPLGPDGLAVSPMGVSGHYGLPVQGFVRAYEAGVNLMFWEPNYRTLTEFFTRLGPSDRRSIHVLAGTFEAEGARIRQDAERVLRSLKLERVAVFLLFWVQSWHRVREDVREELERLKAEGKIGAYGLSTHSRPLAVEAIDAGWDPVMVRHSAAHRGAEERVFPHAAERGTTIITFSNTCYGRLLEPRDGLPPPSAADCYRYTLMQPAVRACLSAPATLAQLEENLAALRDPVLPAERREHLQAVGGKLYEEEVVFRQCVRFV